MTFDDKDIVSVLRQALAQRIGQERYDLWFGAGIRLELRGSLLCVAATDSFSLDRVRHRFREDLEVVCRDTIGGSSRLEFLIDSPPATAARPAEVEASNPGESDSAAKADDDSATAATQPAASCKPSPPAARRRRFARLNSFVVGSGNRVAYTAIDTISRSPGSMSPLFIYGPAGCGKTHLLEATWTAAHRIPGLRRIIYLSAEQFTSYFLSSLRGSGLPNFRRKYRDVELLLIDDVQFFAGKRATLVEFHHTIDTLLRAGRQLVLTADRSPAELSGLGPELMARMAGGLVCGIEPADFATRRRILQQMARRHCISAPDEVLNLVATRLPGDARQLAGALNCLIATSRAWDQAITLEMAELALADIFRATFRAVRLPDIDRVICDVFGLEPDSLQSQRKSKDVSHPRMLAMWLARKYTRAAYSEIGRYFGRRTHSTVISAEQKVNRWVQDGTPIRLAHGNCNVEDALRRLESRLRSG